MSAGYEVAGIVYRGVQAHLLRLLNQVMSKCALLARVAWDGQHVAEESYLGRSIHA